MLENLLSKCGLNKSEQTVLLALLQRGSCPAGELAKAVPLKRPTVYAALESLAGAGLIIKERKRTRVVFRVPSAQSIPKLLERNAKAEFDAMRHATGLLAEELEHFSPKEKLSLGGFDIGTIDSSKAVYAHLEEVLHRGDFSAFFNPQLIPKAQLHSTVAGFLQSTSASRPRIREIAVSGPATNWYRKQIRNPNHLVKEIPPKKSVFSDIILVGGEVVISNYQVNSELAVKIREKNLYQTLMTMFDILWDGL